VLSLLRFNLRRLGEHRVRTLLSISGISIGAALVVAVLALLGSLTGSVDKYSKDLGVADLEITGVTGIGLPEQRFFDVASVKGVAAAVPLVRGRALLGRTEVELVGLDQRAKALRGSLSGGQSAQVAARSGRIGLFAGKNLASRLHLHAGQDIGVFAAGHQTRTTVLGVVEGGAGQFNDGRFLAGPIPLAQQIMGRPGRVDSILILAVRGGDLTQLKRKLARVIGTEGFVDSVSGHVRQARLTTQSLRFGMVMGVTVALIVGGFLIFNTMSMAALERRRELATLRALGGRTSHLLSAFLFEAGLLGLFGSCLGAAFGLLAAKLLVGAIPAYYASKVGVPITLHVPPLAVPAALLAGAGASLIAALAPGYAAVRVPPVEAMRPEGTLESVGKEPGVHWGAALIGASMASLGFFTAKNGPAALGFAGMAALMAGTIICTFGFSQPLAEMTARVCTLFRGPGRLAAAAVRQSPRRAWATSVAVVAGVGMVVAQLGATGNVNASVQHVVSSLRSVDLYVSAAPSTNLATDLLLPEDWSGPLAAIPGVANAATNTFAFINYHREKVLLQAIGSSVGAEPAMAGISPEQRRAFADEGGAVVSTRFSELFHVNKMDVLQLPTSKGRKAVRILGVVPSFTWDRGLISISRDKFLEWFGPSGVSDFLLTYKKGADAGTVRSAVRSLVKDSPVPAYLNSGSEYQALIRGTIGQINRLFDAMAAVVIGAATLAIFNALLISAIERKRELGIMRALGTSRRQVRGMVLVEAMALAAVGGVVGVGTGLLAHRAAIAAVARQGGVPIEFAFVAWPGGVAFLLGIAMALLGSVEPARRAGSFNIVQAIGYE